jgi:hypothetical protein
MNRIVLALCLVLAGCSTFQNPINTTRLAEVESAYGIALSAAVAYRSLYNINRCTASKPESATNICARRSVVLSLQKADREAQVALAAARTFVNNNPTLDASSVINVASQAVGVMRDIESINGIK